MVNNFLEENDKGDNSFIESIKIDSIMIKHPEYLDVIKKQSNIESQKIIYYYYKSSLSKNFRCLNDLLNYTDNPRIQRKILRYYNISLVVSNEPMFMIMLEIDDELLENEVINQIMKGNIKSVVDLTDYIDKYKEKKSKIMKVRNLRNIWKKN